ncbi:hypothetical protein [Nitrospirillum sp. BR 11163]|uniref:hypothetical protein n=1 Tax=Nitrospirillum sp. BR 11163 TaxID=3104323 RepID=UPI002AFF8E8B|nr:hypothetical protein [Nitrospirillum sp. BR 11163]MEA1675226.1 hypothetical protein [Nitrospirillum sp. BR 11163]
MNQALIQQYAVSLEDLLRRYASADAEAARLLSALAPYLDDAKAGRILTPLEHIPGDYYFDEGTLRKYRDLEHAYSKFQIEVTGGEPPALIAFRNRVNAQKN